MNRPDAKLALRRALEISERLAALAEGGDAQGAQSLDAERRRLLASSRAALEPLDAGDRSIVLQIAALNDRALGVLEHRCRGMAREMDMISAGRRALRAYGAVQTRR